jgi:hypothetical protein
MPVCHHHTGILNNQTNMAEHVNDTNSINSITTDVVDDKENVVDMGGQSQNRKKSTVITKKRPKYITVDNKRKKDAKTKQTFLFGQQPKDIFNPLQGCEVCKAQAIGARVPNRAHHLRCPRNSEWGKRCLSEKQALEVERQKKLNKAINEPLPLTDTQKQQRKDDAALKKIINEPLKAHEVNLPIYCAETCKAFFEPRPKPSNKNINNNMSSSVTNNSNNNNNNTINKQSKKMDTTAATHESAIKVNVDVSAAALRMYVDDSMEEYQNAKQPSRKVTCPPPIIMIAKYLRDNCIPPRMSTDTNDCPITPQSVQAMTNYSSIFPTGNLEFIVPKEAKTETPSPYYHSIEGHKLLFVFWELNYPGINLRCTKDNCQGSLIHDRTNFSKDADLFPIYDSGSPHMWAVVMTYKCNCCDSRVAGNEGELLMALPPHIRDAYPVHPRYASGNFHLSNTTSDWLEDLIVTYGNGEYISRSLYQRLNLIYYRYVDNYYEQCKFLGLTKVKKYPELGEWIGEYYPDGAKFRQLYEIAQQSTLTRTGYSEMERYTREIQSVECTLTIAQDHTMEIIKNYLPSNINNAKACWTCCNEFGEVAAAVIVKDTKCSQFAHAAEQLARRNNFQPRVMYADTWPHLEKFWKLIFGFGCIGRLGLFHYLQRIIKTLRDSHCDYRKAILDLCLATYDYNEVDKLRLINALKSGTMARNGYQYTDLEISEMQISGMFKKRYDKWLRKSIYETPTLQDNLQQWFIRYKVKGSEGKAEGRGRLDPVSRKKLFTPDTKDAVDNALISCQYISDVLTIDDVYTSLPPSPHSTHGLNEHMCHRVESRLEGYHAPLSNFGNSGMKRSLADILHMCGTAKYNANIRRKIMATKMSDEERAQVPAHFLNIPIIYHHGNLEIVNKNALSVGVDSPPFRYVRVLKEDNGERFFSEYLQQQTERNIQIAPHLNNDRCQCIMCGCNPTQLLHQVAVPSKMLGLEQYENISDAGAVSPKKKRRVAKKDKEDEVVSTTTVVPMTTSSVNPFLMQQQYWNPAAYGMNPMMNPVNPFSMMMMMMPPNFGPMHAGRKQQQEYCCLPYYRYITSKKPRVGRPPHDPFTCVKLNQFGKAPHK